jgi:hypothetical protein
MDFNSEDGDRAHMPPMSVLNESFGSVDSELATLLGYVSMMSALIEMKVANIAMSVDNKPQNVYMYSLFGRNREVWEKRLPLFSANDAERQSVAFASNAIKAAGEILSERNDLLHRVWSQAGTEPWGGYKGVKPELGKAGSKDPDPEIWQTYSRSKLQDLIRRMGECVDTLQDAVGRVSWFPRKS